jgi:hypothetical protein
MSFYMGSAPHQGNPVLRTYVTAGTVGMVAAHQPRRVVEQLQGLAARPCLCMPSSGCPYRKVKGAAVHQGCVHCCINGQCCQCTPERCSGEDAVVHCAGAGSTRVQQRRRTAVSRRTLHTTNTTAHVRTALWCWSCCCWCGPVHCCCTTSRGSKARPHSHAHPSQACAPAQVWQ